MYWYTNLLEDCFFSLAQLQVYEVTLRHNPHQLNSASGEGGALFKQDVITSSSDAGRSARASLS